MSSTNQYTEPWRSDPVVAARLSALVRDLARGVRGFSDGLPSYAARSGQDPRRLGRGLSRANGPSGLYQTRASWRRGTRIQGATNQVAHDGSERAGPQDLQSGHSKRHPMTRDLPALGFARPLPRPRGLAAAGGDNLSQDHRHRRPHAPRDLPRSGSGWRQSLCCRA